MLLNNARPHGEKLHWSRGVSTSFWLATYKLVITLSHCDQEIKLHDKFKHQNLSTCRHRCFVKGDCWLTLLSFKRKRLYYVVSYYFQNLNNDHAEHHALFPRGLYFWDWTLSRQTFPFHVLTWVQTTLIVHSSELTCSETWALLCQ